MIDLNLFVLIWVLFYFNINFFMMINIIKFRIFGRVGGTGCDGD